MYPEKKEIVLFGVDPSPLKPFVPELKIRMNKGKRFEVSHVKSSNDAYGIFKRIYGRTAIQEHFIMLLLNNSNKLIGYYRHTIGSSNSTVVDVPMLVGLATKALAHGVIISHNHPSGSLLPSKQDQELTQNLTNALKILKINLLDHIIYTPEGFYSFADDGFLNGLNDTTMITIENIISEYPGIDQSILPDALKNDEFEFVQENIDLYHEDETIKKYIDTFVEKLNEVIGNPEKHTLQKKNKGKKGKTNKALTETDVKKPTAKDMSNQVAKVGLEVSFIKRFVGMHGKTKEKVQILNFLNSLQKAIVEKRIRKTSPYADEIKNIQAQLIKCHHQMGNTIKVNIDKKTLEAYSVIAHSEKVMLSVGYIKQYIGLHGKHGVKDKAASLLDRIQKAVESDKINKADLYYKEIVEIQESLTNYLQGKTQSPIVNETTLNGLMGCFSKGKPSRKVTNELHGVESSTLFAIPETTVISSSELAGMDFETIGLKGKYRALIGDPSVGFAAMVYGLPKSGKSTLCIDFARYLAEHHGKVLYVAIEEGFGYTLKEKLERLGAIHPNLIIAEKIPDDVSQYQFVFIDSVSKAGLSSADLSRLRKVNPKVAFVFIFHTTKEGNFRGKQDFAHDVDVIVEVKEGIAKANGRFGIGGQLDIFNPDSTLKEE